MENPDTVTFVASTSDEDRAGDIIDQQGWDLEHYQKNPVVLLSHQWHLPPVGKALKTWVANEHSAISPQRSGTSPPQGTGRLMATVRFAPTPLGRELALLTADGYLRAVSVGFRPIEWEVRRDPRTGFALGAHFHRQELLEISVVSLPANPEALRKALDQAHGESIGVGAYCNTPPLEGLIWTSALIPNPQPDLSGPEALVTIRAIKLALQC